MRRFIPLLQKVAAAVLATAVGVALPALARGDDAGASSGDPTQTLEVVTNDPTVQYAPGQLVVGLADDATRAEVRTAVDEAGATVGRTINAIDTKVLEVPAGEIGDAIDSLEASPAVDYVQPEVVLEASTTIPNDALWKEQWGPARVLAPKVWDSTKGSPSVVVAVVDTGVDYSHPDLQGVFVPGFDLVNNDADPRDDQGHGTAVAGVIAARTQNRVGQAGMCWKCSVMPVKVLDRNGSGPTSTIAAGIVWAVNHGAQVINLSLGGAGTTQVLQDAVSFAASKGVLVLAAAGNSGSTTKFYPAAYPSVVSVGATQEDDTLYSWSNRGADWVQVAAPGCDTAPVRGGGYGNFCGTSAATPVVSGIAGLALSLDPTITPDRLAQALRTTARQGTSGVQYGRVNALRTLAALGLVAPLEYITAQDRRDRSLGRDSRGPRWRLARCELVYLRLAALRRNGQERHYAPDRDSAELPGCTHGHRFDAPLQGACGQRPRFEDGLLSRHVCRKTGDRRLHGRAAARAHVAR